MKRISETEAEELLARMAKFIGLKLVKTPSDARMDRHFFFSAGKARYIQEFFSAKKMLRFVLLREEFWIVPGTWDFGVHFSYQNPFYGLSLEELKIKLDLEEAVIGTKTEQIQMIGGNETKK